jgi:hypothetical protein
MQILLGRNYVNIPAVQIRIAQEQAGLACRRSELATYKSQMLRIQAEEARIILGEQ